MTPSTATFLFTAAFAALMLSANSAAHAANASSHVHGTSDLAIAMEGDVLEVHFTSPAMNLVGFEHQATTHDQIEAVKNAESQLKNHASVLQFQNVQCTHLKTETDAPGLIAESHADSAPDHAHEHHDLHEAGHGDASHREMTAAYRYRCDKNAIPVTIHIGLFDQFPGIQEIHVQWILHTGQGATTLTPNNRTVEIR